MCYSKLATERLPCWLGADSEKPLKKFKLVFPKRNTSTTTINFFTRHIFPIDINDSIYYSSLPLCNRFQKMSTEKGFDRKENLRNCNQNDSALKSRFKFRFRKESISSPLDKGDYKKPPQNKKGLKRFMNRGGSSTRETLRDIRFSTTEASTDQSTTANDNGIQTMEPNATNDESIQITNSSPEGENDSQKKRRVEDNVPNHESPPHDSDVKTYSSVPFSPDAMEADAFQSFYYNKENDSDEESHDEKIDCFVQNEINKDDMYDDIDDDDDLSCASTVIMEDRPPRCIRPPPTSSKEEQAKFYWEWCYGTNSPFPNNNVRNTEKQPLKSCLSAKKTQWTEIAKSATKRREMRQALEQMTPNENVVQSHWNTSSTNHIDNSIHNNNNSMTHIHTTPKMTTPPNAVFTSSKKKVQFGSASAAEFKSSRPTVELTPLTKDQAMKEFPLDKEIIEEEEEEHQETAINGAILAAWDDVFDDYANDDFDDGDSIMLMNDDDDDGNENTMLSSRSLVTHSGSRRKSVKGRRSSSFFQRENGGSLLPNSNGVSSSETNDFDMETEYIRQDHSSPSKRDSLLFSSPSELGDSWRLSTSDSEGSRITPITDVTSSSSVLRSLHCSGGAHMGHSADDLYQKDLQPNQLDLKLQRAEACEMMDCTNNDDDLINMKSADTFESQDLHLILRSSLIDVIREHELTVSMFASDIGMNVDEQRLSLLGMKCDVDVVTQSQTSWFPYQDYTVDLLKNAIDILEDQNLIHTQNASDFTSQLKLLQIHPRKYKDELYEFCTRSAITKWLSCEEEALRSSLAWLAESLKQMYITEESTLANLLNDMKSISLIESVSKKSTQSQIDTELNNIEKLQQCIYSEDRMLQKARLQAEYLESRCELEYNRLHVDDSNYKVLHSILPYTCHFEDDLTISYPHFDNETSSTIVKWKPHNSKMEESVESKQSLSPLMSHSEPSIILAKFQHSNIRAQFPEGSAALELYSKILNSDVLKGFILNQFKVEDELAVLTTADSYSAIDCLILDLLHLERTDGSDVQVIDIDSNAFDIVLSLRLDKCHSVGLRFSYALTQERTLLNFLPCNISVTPNESNGSYEHLSTFISKYISTAPRNTFLLSSICSHVRNNTFR